MLTNIYEVDAFTGRRGKLVLRTDTDYRFEKGDEFVVEQNGGSTPMRVVKVRVVLRSESATRDIDAMKL